MSAQRRFISFSPLKAETMRQTGVVIKPENSESPQQRLKNHSWHRHADSIQLVLLVEELGDKQTNSKIERRPFSNKALLYLVSADTPTGLCPDNPPVQKLRDALQSTGGGTGLRCCIQMVAISMIVCPKSCCGR